MYTFIKDGISVLTVLDKRREYEGCLYKIRIRVIYQRKIWEFTPGCMVTEDVWKNELPKSKSPKIVEIRKDLQSSFELVKRHVRELSDSGDFSFELMNNRMKAGAGDTINAAFKTKISDLAKEGREGTRLYYDNVLKGIERFKGENIKLKSVSVVWLRSYEKFLLSEKTGNKEDAKGKSFTTVGFHMRAIRTIMNKAKTDKLIKDSDYPFGEGGYKITTGKGRHLALTLSQIAQIFEYSDGKESTAYYRDLFVFSYLCNGINFADLARLKYSDIESGEVVWLRQKTINTDTVKEEIQAYLTPEMQLIIDRWGNDHKPTNFIFPILTGNETQAEIKTIVKNTIKHTNNRLERIGKELNLGKISTYTARHSFATILKNSGANISFISESLGHANIGVTKNYLSGFEKSERIKNAATLTNFVAESDIKENEPK
jgi:integrase/recombinase XerD